MPLKDSEKEQTKLLATALNTIAVNMTIVGLVVPVAASLYGLGSAPMADRLVPACFVWPLSGVVLHLFARATLEGLDP